MIVQSAKPTYGSPLTFENKYIENDVQSYWHFFFKMNIYYFNDLKIHNSSFNTQVMHFPCGLVSGEEEKNWHTETTTSPTIDVFLRAMLKIHRLKAMDAYHGRPTIESMKYLGKGLS